MNKKTISGTKEWAVCSLNIMFGCQHGCKYCYARAMSPRHGKISPDTWENVVVRQKKVDKGYGKRKGMIMFPSAHDLHPENMNAWMTVIGKLLEAGNDLLLVTKPHMKSILAVCEEFTDFRQKILFRFSIGSSYPSDLAFWEPNAPSLDERLACLNYARVMGYRTSVSAEPLLLQPIHDDDMVQEVVEFVELLAPDVNDAIWIGKPNKLFERLKINGFKDEETIVRATALLQTQTDPYIHQIHDRLKDHPKVKWKESIKKIVGIELPTEKGLDI